MSGLDLVLAVVVVPDEVHLAGMDTQMSIEEVMGLADRHETSRNVDPPNPPTVVD